MDESDRDIRLAWVTAALSRAKKMPDLKSLLSTRHRRQTPEEQLLVMRQIAARLGKTIREVPRNGE